jgi:excisionase family DNA binding protein
MTGSITDLDVVRMPTRFYTMAEAAAILRTTRKTLRLMIQAGHIHGARMGTTWRIPEESIAEFVRGGGCPVSVHTPPADAIVRRPRQRAARRRSETQAG